MTDEPADDELVERSLGGDTQAFTMLIERYQKWIYTVVRNQGNGAIDHEEARDITQEVAKKVWEKLGTLKKNQSFKAWLTRITTNTTIDVLRKKRRIPPYLAWEDLQSKGKEQDLNLSIKGPEDEMIKKENQDELLAMLPPKERLCYVLDRQGYSHKEIAEQVENALGRMAVRSVPVYISKAKKNLQNFHRIMMQEEEGKKGKS